MPSFNHCLIYLFVLGFLQLCIALPTNVTYLVPRKDYEPGDTLGRTMCFCTNDNKFTQAEGDPYSISVAPADHKVAFVIDHHFALHMLDVCTTNTTAKHSNPCLSWQKQHHDWCHEFHVDEVPRGVKYHSWKFCYQFRGDDFINPKHRDYWTFFMDKRGLPRKRDWIADEVTVKDRCEEVCRAKWDMEMLEDKRGGWFSRVDYFHVGSPFSPQSVRMMKDEG
ncbi:MAG: hypothetical protein Q9181_005226 [Wetmoreana brouardii]